MWIQTIEIFIVFYNNLGKGITEFRKELNEWNRQMGGKAKKTTSEWMFSLFVFTMELDLLQKTAQKDEVRENFKNFTMEFVWIDRSRERERLTLLWWRSRRGTDGSCCERERERQRQRRLWWVQEEGIYFYWLFFLEYILSSLHVYREAGINTD